MIAGHLAALRRLTGKLTAPVVAQGIMAATSLMLQMVAAHSLGLAEFGLFGVFLALLWTATAVYTGYVGDGLTVLDRHEPAVRSALVTSALTMITLSAAIAVGAALVARHGDLTLAIAYAATVVTWLARDTVRRLLIARQEFARLVVNDVLYMMATFVMLVALSQTVRMSILSLFIAMVTGAAVAITAGLFSLPRTELKHVAPGWRGTRMLASFAAWRSAQATLRPAALLLARVLVANLLSLTAVGLLEAARLVAAPMQVVLNGAAAYLLARFAAAERTGELRSGRLAANASWLLLGITVVAGGALAALSGPAGRLMTGGSVDSLVVLGWVAYLATWAVGLPYIMEVVTRQLSRQVFTTRLVDSVVGLTLVVIALLAGAGIVVVPWLMAIGGVYSAWRMRALAISSRARHDGR